MARVLVVEDNEVNLELMRYLLLAYRHEVLVARDGEEGLRLLREQRPEVVVCDIEMPRLDGPGLARAARADPATAGVPLLAVTSNAMVGDRARFMQAGFSDYLAKPIDPTRFVAWLETHLPAGAPTQPPHAHPTLSGSAAAPGAGPLVLVVDDVPANLALKRSVLEPLGYRVHTAASAEAALALACEHPPELIISDVGMPEGDGFEFIARVKQVPALREVPFIFVSSTHWDALSKTKAIALGAQRYLNRPLPPELLAREVADVLRDPRRRG